MEPDVSSAWSDVTTGGMNPALIEFLKRIQAERLRRIEWRRMVPVERLRPEHKRGLVYWVVAPTQAAAAALQDKLAYLLTCSGWDWNYQQDKGLIYEPRRVAILFYSGRAAAAANKADLDGVLLHRDLTTTLTQQLSLRLQARKGLTVRF